MIHFVNIDNKKLHEVDAKIEAILDDCPQVLKPMMQHLKQAKGKNIRAALMVATAAAFGNVTKNAINMAAAVEVLHLSTLIHDDILDNATKRRGIETLHKKFGNRMAVLAGDYLFTKCFVVASQSGKDRTSEMASVVSAVCLGEALQQQNIGNYNLTKAQYLKIIAGKTAAMFVFGMFSAAHCAESENNIAIDETTFNRLAKGGYYLGMVFQMIDDCLDYEGKTEILKKPLLKDLEQGVITYPMIALLQKKPELKNMLSKKIFAKDRAFLQSQVKQMGGLLETKALADVYYHRAKQKILSAVSSENAQGILEVLNLVYHRNA